MLSSISLFFVSLTQQCYCTQSSCLTSFQVLLTGWAGLYLRGPMLCWLANPVLFLSWKQIKDHPKWSLLLSGLALCLSISFLFFREIYNQNDEWKSTITYYKSGYWLWLASSITMVIGNSILSVSKSKLNDNLRKNLTIMCTVMIVMAALSGAVFGLHTKKNISVNLNGACGVEYEFTGNLDTLDKKYVAAFLESGLCICKSYQRERDVNTAKIIMWLYGKHGHKLKRADSMIKSYSNVDTLVKYKNFVFDPGGNKR